MFTPSIRLQHKARLQLLQQTFVSEITVNLINYNVEAKAIKIDSKGEMNHNHQEMNHIIKPQRRKFCIALGSMNFNPNDHIRKFPMLMPLGT